MVLDRVPPPPGGPPDRSVTTKAVTHPVIVLIASIAMIALVGCGSEAAYEKIEPYELTETESGINEVALTQRASERLQMESAPITAADGNAGMTVPYAALIYDTNGDTWVYQQTDSLKYKRVPVVVDYIEGDTVYLSEAPEAGTPVAITSVAELYGTDTGVGK